MMGRSGAVAVDDAGEGIGQKFLKDVGAPAGATGEEREGGADERPKSRLCAALFRGRLVDVRSRFVWQRAGQFVVDRVDRFGGAVLQRHEPDSEEAIICFH